MFSTISNAAVTFYLLLTVTLLSLSSSSSSSSFDDDNLIYIWPLPSTFTSGNHSLSVDPNLSLSSSSDSTIISDAFLRYKRLIFSHSSKFSGAFFDISALQITVHSSSDELQLGVDESYILRIPEKDDHSIVGVASIEANTVYGALRALENVLHWHIVDEESFPLETPSYPNLWKGSYSRWERYTVEDAYEIVNFAKTRGGLPTWKAP